MTTPHQVWYSDKSVTVYHLDWDCRALYHVDPENFENMVIDLNETGETEREGFRLCGHC